MLVLEVRITTSRLVIDDKIRLFHKQMSIRICESKKLKCESHIHFSLSLIKVRGKLGKYNYSKASRNKNI